MSAELLKMSTRIHPEHQKFLSTSEATNHTGQTLTNDKGYSKLMNDKEVLQEPLQEWLSLSVQGYTTEREEDNPITQRLPELATHQSDILDNGTPASTSYPAACDFFPKLSAQYERYDLTGIQMIPNLRVPQLSAHNGSRAFSSKLNGTKTNPEKVKIINVKTPAERSSDRVEKPFDDHTIQYDTKILNRRGTRNVYFPKEQPKLFTKIENLSSVSVETFEVKSFDEHKQISKDDDRPAPTKPQISHEADYELSNYLLSHHTWLAEDEIELVQGSSQHACYPGSEHKDDVENRMALIEKSSAVKVKNVRNASDLNTFFLENFKIDHSEDCTLLADSELTFYPGETGLRTLSADSRVDSVEIEAPGKGGAFNDPFMDHQKMDAQNTSQFVPSWRDPQILRKTMLKQVTDVKKMVASGEKQDHKLSHKCAKWPLEEATPKTFDDSRVVTTDDLSYKNNPKTNAASVNERHESQIPVGKLGSRLLNFNPRNRQDGSHLVPDCNNEQVTSRSEHQRVAAKEAGHDNHTMPETKASGTTSDLYNCMLAKFQLSYLDDTDLLTPQRLELYVGESDYGVTLAANDSVHQEMPQAERTLSGALLKHHALENQVDSSFVPYKQFPYGESEEKALACVGVKCGQGCIKRTSAGTEKILDSGCRPLMRVDSSDLNNLHVILEKDLHLDTEHTESEEIVSDRAFSSEGSCGLCHNFSVPNNWDYYDEVTFVADLFDPILPPNSVENSTINEHESEITQPNINGQVEKIGFYNWLLTEVDLSRLNNYTLVLGNHLNRYTENNDTRYTVLENEPAADVSSIENPTRTNALNVAGRYNENGLCTIEEEVSLVCKDFLESTQTDESTTLYEATFLPGIKAAEIPDPRTRHIGIPVYKNYGIVNHPTFVSLDANSIENNVIIKAMDHGSSQLPEDEEVTLVSISECEDNLLGRMDTDNAYLPAEKPGLPVNNVIKIREICISSQYRASEFAFVGTSQPDDALMTCGYEPGVNQSNNRKIKSHPRSPPSPRDNHFVLKAPNIEPELAYQLTKCLPDTSSSNAKPISSFDGRSYPAAFPVVSDNLNNLAFVPVSAAEIAARIDKLLGPFNIEGSKMGNPKSGNMFDSNSKLRSSSHTSTVSTDSVGISRRTAPPRRLQNSAPELAARLLDKGIAVFDGDTQYIPQLQKPVVYCTLDCGYTFTIQLENQKLMSLRTRPFGTNLKDERSSTSLYQWVDTALWTDSTKTKSSKPKSSQGCKCCLGTLSPGQSKVVRIRQRKSSEQDENYLQNSETPVTEKLVRCNTTRELPLESVYSRDSRFDSFFTGFSSTGESDRISVLWSHSKPVPQKRSTRLFTKDPVGYRSSPRTFKRVSKLDIPTSSNFQSQSNTPQVLHLYTPGAFFTVGSNSEPEEHQMGIGNGAVSDHMNTSQFVRHETPHRSFPKPFTSPLFYTVYANDEDSDTSSISSRS